MCGISGIAGPQEDGWISTMNDVQAHRGPDGEGIYRDREAGLSLGQRRLAIIDLAGGRQPMVTADERFALVFNGEIFNAPALRRELEAQGVVFATDHSDTEVLLHLLVRQGKQGITRLNGMFAFAFYDRQRRRLLCARDRFGIKPFHWTSDGRRFAFASELKSLRRLPFVSDQLDTGQLAHYLSLHYVPGPGSIFTDIHKLPAGHLLEWELETGTSTVECWWRPQVGMGPSLSRRDWIDAVRAELAAAVRRWTLADVPVACSLSGGLDSPSILALMAQSGTVPDTYSVGFSGKGEAAWSELPLARAAADKWGARHHEIIVDPDSLLDDLLAMVWSLDEPYAGGLPSWAVFKAIGAAGVKVAMTGTGGDELFGNYGQWRGLERAARGLLPVLSPLSASTFRRRFHDKAYYLPDSVKQGQVLVPGLAAGSNSAALLHGFYAQDGVGLLPRDRVAAMDVRTQLPEEFLMMTDRFSMAHSVEARTPFLDSELATLALSIPARIRTDHNDPKGFLREAVADLLPGTILTSPKRGFTLPLSLWLRGRLRPLCDALLSPACLRRQGLFRDDFHDRFVRRHQDGHADLTRVVWPVLMFQVWYKVFVDGSLSDGGNAKISDLL